MAVGWAKVMAPFRDAVSFVNGDTAELALGIDGTKHTAKRFRKDEFRGYIN